MISLVRESEIFKGVLKSKNTEIDFIYLFEYLILIFMKNLLFLFLCLSFSVSAQQVDLSYYLPADVTYNKTFQRQNL